MNTDVENSEKLEDSDIKNILAERRSDEWMLRPCDMYKEEYSDCTSIKSRFNQYFIYGEIIDCSQWKKDFKNCKKWSNKKDDTAYEELIASEKRRRILRLRGHYENKVWEKRDKPPENWSSPLPEWLQKRFTDSYLDHKSRELKSGENGVVTQIDKHICTIL